MNRRREAEAEFVRAFFVIEAARGSGLIRLRFHDLATDEEIVMEASFTSSAAMEEAGMRLAQVGLQHAIRCVSGSV